MKKFNIILFIVFNLSLAGHSYPTRDEIFEELIKQDILYPDIVLKQAKLETNYGKSGVGRYKNNLFGFRKTNRYINFKHWKESVNYYKKWQEKKIKEYIKEKGYLLDYYDFICWSGWKDGKKYSTKGKKYIEYLKKIKIN
ncbi:MAG: glucosaminidase domain-containing protein [Candidatus Woesearchaeota archaeon]